MLRAVVDETVVLQIVVEGIVVQQIVVGEVVVLHLEPQLFGDESP
jgi:hypothetical protein